MDTSARGNPVTEAIDGATGDWSMSGDAMRWSPDLARRAPTDGELGGAVDGGSGVGAALGLDIHGVRRLVSGALTSLGTVAGELRQITRGSSEEDDAPS